MNLEDITDTLIVRHFDAKILARGRSYFEDDAVENPTLRGDTLTAEVEGSEDEPYQITITLGQKDIEDAACTCPYGDEYDGWCKQHIAATMLLCSRKPEQIRLALPPHRPSCHAGSRRT